MIHVCYGLYDGNGRYSKFTGTSILSIFENTRAEVTVHLLHDDTLTADNRDKFSYLAGQYNQLIKFYNVEKICATELEEIKKIFENERNLNAFSMGKFYRLLTPKLISEDIDQIIYLDADIIVNLDINELWQIPIEDEPIAAVPEIENGVNIKAYLKSCRDGIVNPEDYFNSGVVVLNLKKIRQSEMDNLHEKIEFRAKNPQYCFFDQEILNYCFSKNYLILPNRFNFFVRESRWRNEFETENRILHYLSGSLNLDMNDTFNRLWFSYFEKTLWFNKEIVLHLYEELIKFDIDRKNLAIKTAAVVSGKKRVFFIEEKNVAALKPIFCVSDDEEVGVIVAKDIQSIQALKESMKASAGSKVYFILIGDGYKFLHNELVKEGFTEGRDFINAVQFLSNAYNIPLDTYNFIKAL